MRRAIVILGAAVWRDGPSPTLRRRTEHAARVWHDMGGQDWVVPCGGLGQFPPAEAIAMQAILQSCGVRPGKIIPEGQSTSTYENLRNASIILRKQKIDEIVIVTDRYHGPRALLVAWALGLRARLNAPASSSGHKAQTCRMVLREIAAFPAYAIRLVWWRWRDRNF